MNRAIAGLLALLTVGPAARSEDVLDPFATVEPGAKAVFQPTPGGLRVLTPPAALTRLLKLPFRWEAPAAVSLGGDFEVSASFDVRMLGDQKAEANVELAVLARGDGDRPLGINVTANSRDGKCFRVVRVGPNRAGVHWNILQFPRQSDRGRVCIRRRGAELVFLSADGPDAPLVELVRYPDDPRSNPAPRLTAWQGQSGDPAPVDVTLTDIRVRADKVLRGPAASAATPRPAAPVSYPVAFDYGPNPVKFLVDFPRGGDGREFKAEAGGVRLRAAPPAGKVQQGFWFRESRFVLEGDFEVSCRVDPAGVGPGTAPGAYDIGFSLETDSPLGSAAVGWGVAGAGGPRYGVTRHHPTRKGPNWDTQRVRAGSGPCRLAARRTGAELTVSTQEDGEPAARELVRFPFPPDIAPRVRVWAYQDGPLPGPIDVLLGEFKARAARAYDPDNPAPVTAPGPAATGPPGQEVVLDGLPTDPPSRKWTHLAWAGGALALAGLTAAAVVRRTRRPGWEVRS